MPLKILVVEDDPATLEFMSEVLRAQDVQVHPVGDSLEALGVISEEKFDGIFLDLQMPNLDGFELARRIRQSALNRKTPIVIVTGREEKDIMGLAFRAGGTFFLHKPVDRYKLTELMNSTRGSMVQERQRSTRVPLNTVVECQVGGRTVAGMGINLSLAGLLFQALAPLEVGNSLQVSFWLPSQQEAIRIAGSVVRVEEDKRVAIQFGPLSPKDRQRILEFVTTQGETL